MGTRGAGQVEAYLAAQPEPQQRTLRSVRAVLVRLLPHADECIKYGVPALALGGTGVAGYAGFAKHCAYFPMSGSVVETAGPVLDGYVVSKGGVQFPIDRPPPVALLRQLVRLRLDEAAAVTDGRQAHRVLRRRSREGGGVDAVGLVARCVALVPQGRHDVAHRLVPPW